MRDYLCDEDYLKKKIDIHTDYLYKDIEAIAQLKEDIINGVQRHRLPSETVLSNYNKGMFRRIRDLIAAKYSLGLSCEEIEPLFGLLIPYFQVEPYVETGFLNIIKFISLGILLEVPRETMQIMVDFLDESQSDDLLLDYLICAYGLKRKVHSTGYYKEIPYREVIEIAKVAKQDKKKASAMLIDYTEKKYIKGHSDCGWTTFHKEPGYIGLWSYEAGAIAKILQLNDDELVNSNHYPYDLVHYKNMMQFNQNAIDEFMEAPVQKDTESEWYAETIPVNADLERIVPGKFRGLVNQVIADYKSLSEREFYDKYELQEIWFEFKDFVKENKKGLLGTLLVFILVDHKYILQLDYKEDLEDYKQHIKNHWKAKDTILIQFDLGNDQQYIARVPKNYSLQNMYEIKISTCH